MSAINDLITLLRDPAAAQWDDAGRWSALISVARAEMLIGTVATRLGQGGLDNARRWPAGLVDFFAAQRTSHDQAQRLALWEAEMARRALRPHGIPVILLKGTAFAAAELPAAHGRQIGDLDILVPEQALPVAEQALRAAGWEWVKDNSYDQAYYRDHMHELPPLIHEGRDRMIDVHHTILPRTHRITPNAAALIADAQPISSPLSREHDGLYMLSPGDMICHAAAHLFADGNLAGGLRNLWDIDRLLRHFADKDANFWPTLDARAQLHGLGQAIARALRLSHQLYATPVPGPWRAPHGSDALFRRHLLARDDWGRDIRPITRLSFYVRSHWMRMPPVMLARHLFVKSRKMKE